MAPATSDDKDFICRTHYFGSQELMRLQVLADENDVEGVKWWGNEGNVWVSHANGGLSSPIHQMGGRPIGFRVWMGVGGLPNQPILMSVVYNTCNCPASTFIGNNTFSDMEIEAKKGLTQT